MSGALSGAGRSRGVASLDRGDPKAITLLLPAWGFRYVRQFLEFGLPTLLAPGNVPALAQALPCTFVILTTSEDEAYIREHRSFARLSAVCRTEVRRIDHLVTGSNYSTTITLAYTEAVRAAGPAMVDTCFVFLVSDYVVADGSLASVLRAMRAGASAVLVGNCQVIAEDAMAWLRAHLDAASGALVLPARELMRWALAHLHPATVANVVNFPLFHNAHTNRLFWRVDAGTLLGRFYLMHMVCIRPEVTAFNIGSSCDYSFVPEMCPSGNVVMMTDSDDYLVIEMQPEGHESGFLRPGPLRPSVLARTLGEWTTARHRQNAGTSVILHAAGRPASLAATEAEVDAYVRQVVRAIRRRPQPHRGHPYWRGAIATFREATGQKLDTEEWRLVLGIPDPRSQVLERTRYALFGRPPRVRAWHPLWPDYRHVLAALAPFFADPGWRLLTISDVPTPFTVMLADNGERVVRLQTTPFLRNPPARYEALRDRFDLCLLEFTESDMERAPQLMDRIAPLMKAGGRMLMVIYNRRSLGDAKGFGASIARHGQRLLRPSAWLAEVHFVPASRLRWALHRAMVRLGWAAHRRPWIGIPVLAASAGFLTGLTFVANLVAASATRARLPRGIISSAMLVLHVDRSEQELESQTPVVAATGAGPPGAPSIASTAAQAWHEDPHRLAIVLARYRFVANTLAGRAKVAEVGCGGAFGARIVGEQTGAVAFYQFVQAAMDDPHKTWRGPWPPDGMSDDNLATALREPHDAIYSLDVIERLTREDEDAVLVRLRDALAEDGLLVVGVPSVEAGVAVSCRQVDAAPNRKSATELKRLLEQYFTAVFIYSQRGEAIHPGCDAAGDYIVAVCCGKR
jgi:hypothetical protein